MTRPLAAAAVEAGMRGAWYTLYAFGTLVRRHRIDDTVAKMVGQMVRADPTIVDDIGLVPVPTHAVEALCRLVDAAFERHTSVGASR